MAADLPQIRWFKDVMSSVLTWYQQSERRIIWHVSGYNKKCVSIFGGQSDSTGCVSFAQDIKVWGGIVTRLRLRTFHFSWQATIYHLVFGQAWSSETLEQLCATLKLSEPFVVSKCLLTITAGWLFIKP